MALYKYSQQPDKASTSKAQAYDLDLSYKDLANICAAIKGKTVEEARRLLDDAIGMRFPIFYGKFNKGAGHRPMLGGKKGRYPKKECREMLSILHNAAANAARKGLDESALVVKHAAAYKQNVLPRYRRFWPGGATLGYGKQAIRADYITARVELILQELPGLKGKKGEKTAAGKKRKKGAENKGEGGVRKEEKKGNSIPADAKEQAGNAG